MGSRATGMRELRREIITLALLTQPMWCLALQPLPRRAIFAGAAAAAVAAPPAGRADTAAPQGFEALRAERIGGGADMRAGNDGPHDVFYPPSLIGLWRCERTVTSVEGDVTQAEGAWRLLGGDGASFRQPEAYLTRYIPQPAAASAGEDGNGKAAVVTQADGGVGVILDRGFELDARVHGAAVRWDERTPNELSYARSVGGRGGAAALRVVQRSVEPPSDKGWGLNELVLITTASDVPGVGRLEV